MGRTLTFGQRIAASFAAIVVLTLIIGSIAIYALRSVVSEKDAIVTLYGRNLIDSSKMHAQMEKIISQNRGFFLTREQRFLEIGNEAVAEFNRLVSVVKANVRTPEELQNLDKIDRAAATYVDVITRAQQAAEQSTTENPNDRQFEEEGIPLAREVRAALEDFIQLEERLMSEATNRSTAYSSWMQTLMLSIAAISVIVAIALAFLLTTVLGKQIGAAVQSIRSSSTELQAAANQQTTGAREQATATNEIATTIKELVATSHQIAESAIRVAGIAEETNRAAESGEATVKRSQEAIANIKKQVDVIVTHMLDLGKKSQQVGGILEVINELAEQTNILAINASIEAAGAGEMGRRFSVVAEEIRGLADRVGGSAKEIRSLLDEVRSAVHTTVMATETGSKAVDDGAKQFGEVSVVFQEILRQVETTTQAAREIELSTKQQTTAVEQVNEAINNVAQAAKESEISSNQTLQTATELTNLSRDLSRLVHSQAAA